MIWPQDLMHASLLDPRAQCPQSAPAFAAYAYALQVLPALQHFLTVQHAELLPCRCRATECMGLLLEHLGASQQVATELIPQVRAAA